MEKSLIQTQKRDEEGKPLVPPVDGKSTNIGVFKSCLCCFLLWTPIILIFVCVKLWPWKILLCIVIWVEAIFVVFSSDYSRNYDPAYNQMYVIFYIGRCVLKVLFFAIIYGLKFYYKHRNGHPVCELQRNRMKFEERVRRSNIDNSFVSTYRLFSQANAQEDQQSEELFENLCDTIVEDEEARRKKDTIIMTFVATVLYIGVWSICKWKSEPTFLEDSIILLPRFITYLLVSVYIYWAVLSLLFEVRAVLRCRIAFSKKLEKMLSLAPKEEEEGGQTDLFDVLDPKTIRTWTNLRTLLMNFGQDNIDQSKVYLQVILGLYLLRVSFFWIFGIIRSEISTSFSIFWITYGGFIVLQILIFAHIVSMDSKVHKECKAHLSLLRENRAIIEDILPLNKEHRVEPANPIYQEIYKRLTSNLQPEIYRKSLVEALKNSERHLKIEKASHWRFFLGSFLTFLIFLIPVFEEEVRRLIFEPVYSIEDIIIYILVLVVAIFILYVFYAF